MLFTFYAAVVILLQSHNSERYASRRLCVDGFLDRLCYTVLEGVWVKAFLCVAMLLVSDSVGFLDSWTLNG